MVAELPLVVADGVVWVLGAGAEGTGEAVDTREECRFSNVHSFKFGEYLSAMAGLNLYPEQW